jgi:hypothetical protein
MEKKGRRKRKGKEKKYEGIEKRREMPNRYVHRRDFAISYEDFLVIICLLLTPMIRTRRYTVPLYRMKALVNHLLTPHSYGTYSRL